MVTFLSHFTPSMMPEDVIEAIFVQREPLASRLVALIRESVLGEAKHHTLIVGPRGIGKTHLASLVYHRVRGMADLQDQIRIAWLREEEWGIASFLDFVIRVLRALNEEYPEAGLTSRIEGLFALPVEAAEREAVGFLDEFVGTRTVFLITENLDQLFEGLDDVGQQQFRAYLQDRASWTILATAPGLFNGISLQSSPFYGFFRIRHLEELSVDEAIKLLEKIAELGEREDLASFVRTPVGRARIRAVHHLAGGNHRIYVIFSEFLTRETLDDLVEPFLTTMDHLTPYYQARMQSLSPQMRKIIDYLCEVRHAVPVKEIAHRCFITQQTASAQLKQLKERGFVRSFTVGRESHYELLEPLLRLSLEVKKQRGEPIRLFVDFLRFWYTKPELEQRIRRGQITNRVDREYFERALKEWETTPNIPPIHLHKWQSECWGSLNSGDFDKALELSESLVRLRGHSEDHTQRAICLIELQHFDAAVESVRTSIDIAPDEPTPWLIMGVALYMSEHLNDAVGAFERYTAYEKESDTGWSWLGRTHKRLGNSEAAFFAFGKALHIDSTNVIARVEYIDQLRRLERYEDALSIAEADSRVADNDEIIDAKSSVLVAMGREQDAVELLRRSIEVAETAPKQFALASILCNMDTDGQAETAVDRVLTLDPKHTYAWLLKGTLRTKVGAINEALSAFRRATELEPDLALAHLATARLLETANRFPESLAAYNRALEADPSEFVARLRLATVHAKLEQWASAVATLSSAFSYEHDLGTGDWDSSRDLLCAWLLKRSSPQWIPELSEIARMYSEQNATSILSVSVVRSLEALVTEQNQRDLGYRWVTTWAALAEIYPGLEIGVRLLRAGLEYHSTGDPRHLLELASEERSMVESIPGIRPLADLT